MENFKIIALTLELCDKNGHYIDLQFRKLRIPTNNEGYSVLDFLTEYGHTPINKLIEKYSIIEPEGFGTRPAILVLDEFQPFKTSEDNT